MPSVRSLTRPLVLGLATCGVGCVGVQMQSQETRLVHDAEADAFELLILSHGLAPIGTSEDEIQPWVGPQTPGQALERATSTVAAWAAGERRVAFVFAPLDIDVDQIVASGRDDVSPNGQRAAALLADVEVLGAGAFVDERERLATWQRLRVPHAQGWVAFANEALRDAIVTSIDPSVPESEEHERLAEELSLSPRSVELMIARARSEDGWFELTDEGLVVDLPIVRADLVHGLRSGFETAAQEEAARGASATAMFLTSIARHLERVVLEDERTVLVLSPSEGDVFVMRSGEEPAAYDPTLLEHWRSSDRELATGVDLAALRGARAN